MSKKRNTLVFSGAVPTEPDVRKISEAIGVPEEGALIAKTEISDITGLEADTYRWKTVVTAWRKKLYREHNVVLVAVPREGYRVADPLARVMLSGSKLKSGLRHVKRAGDITGRTDQKRLSPQDRRAADHIVSVSAQIALTAATEAKKLKYSPPIKSLAE